MFSTIHGSTIPSSAKQDRIYKREQLAPTSILRQLTRPYLLDASYYCSDPELLRGGGSSSDGWGALPSLVTLWSQPVRGTSPTLPGCLGPDSCDRVSP